MTLGRCIGCGLSERALNQRKGWWECSKLPCPQRKTLTVAISVREESPTLAEEKQDADGQRASSG